MFCPKSQVCAFSVYPLIICFSSYLCVFFNPLSVKPQSENTCQFFQVMFLFVMSSLVNVWEILNMLM
jgi:hypothetical protein